MSGHENGETRSQTRENGEADNENEECRDIVEIPTLPKGSTMSLRLLSNWGDAAWIGLSTIEIFLESGRRATVGEITCNTQATEGDLQSIAVIDMFGIASWKAALPLPDDPPITIDIPLANNDESIAMIRLWNSCESRVYANRGVKEMEILLDEILIFRGFLSPSFSSDEADTGDTILFTTSESILELIAENDVCLLPAASNTLTDNQAVNIVPRRPTTAEKSDVDEKQNKMTETTNATPAREARNAACKVVFLELLSTWGVRELIGLTGIEFFDFDGETIANAMISDITLENGEGNVEKLINGRNITRNAEDMWITPFVASSPPAITVHFKEPLQVAGVSVWNYNASAELSYAGVRCMNVHIDNRLMRKNVVLRKAIGSVFFDFVQDICFHHRSLNDPQRPGTSFIFQLCLLSTWGDEFYIGLNGIEVRDANDKVMNIRPQNLAAFPESVNILPQVHNDPRRSENLINGINDTEGAEHAWLTPVLPNRCARVFFVFDQPTYISKLVLYNYRKTPSRGVRHLSVSIDDVIVWSGELVKSTDKETGVMEISLREQNSDR